MKHYKINISKIVFNIMLIINFLSAIQIPCLGQYIPNISLIYTILNACSFVILIIMLKKIKINGFFKFILIYYLVLVISTINSSGSTFGIIREMICNLTIIIVLNTLSKEQFKENINNLVITLEILTLINLLIIFIFPDGLYNIGYARKYFLFDHVNISIRYLLPGCCFELIRSYLKCNKIDNRCKLYFLLVILTLLFTTPATGIIGFATFILAFILIKKNILIKKIITPFNSILGTSLISYLIIVVNIQVYFANFIQNVLHKDITFTGRTLIWQRALNAIINNPLIGYGRLSLETRVNILKASSAHNQFLVIIFEGGIILLLINFIIMFCISKKIKKCKNTLISPVLISAIFAYCIMWITEPFSYTGTTLMFIIWLLAYRSSELFIQNQNVRRI